MKPRSFAFILAILLFAYVSALISPAFALTDYQRGVLDGLGQGWSMAQMYDSAVAGDSTRFNQAVPEYNAWIESIFGANESLMLKAYPESGTAGAYQISRSYSPVHSIDASWNQSGSLLPNPDAYGMIDGVPAESYYSIGPALADF